MNWHEMSDNEKAELVSEIEQFKRNQLRLSDQTRAKIEELVKNFVEKKGIPPTRIFLSPIEMFRLTADTSFGIRIRTACGPIPTERSGGFCGGEGEYYYDNMEVE